jgi:TolB-like protein/Flp pilus assembly protein TadD
MANQFHPHIVQFGVFEFEASCLELRRRGVKVRVQGQPLQVLAALVEQPGTLVTRDALARHLWPQGTFVDFEHGLNAAVKRLRQALGDSGTNPRFIETLARRGYRFTAPVERRPRAAVRTDAVIPSGSSVAVLPFLHDDQSSECEYLVDGLVDRLISHLSKIRSVRVMAASAVFRFKGRRSDPISIGRRLRSDVILTGAITQRGSELTIDAELVDVPHGWCLWNAQYRRPLDDAMSVEEISRAISSQLRSLSGQAPSRFSSRHTTSPEAYLHYLKGRFFLNKVTAQDIQRASKHFTAATTADPRFALGHAGLADCFSLLAFHSLQAPHDVLPEAKRAALAALALDDELAEAHTSLASIKKTYEWDWAGAEREYRQALELDPNCVTAHRGYAAHLAALGRWDESLAAIHRALELDPLSPILGVELAWHWYMAREFDKARAQSINVLEFEPDFTPAAFVLGLANTQLGHYEDALQAFRNAAARVPNPAILASEAYTRGVMGRRDEAATLLRTLENQSRQHYVAPYWFAVVHAGLNDADAALTWLDRGLEQRDVWLVWLKDDPRVDAIRSHARFDQLLRRVGLAGGRSYRADSIVLAEF